MTDRELLEMAAKAAGICGIDVDSGINIGSNSVPIIWNPLTDDGDAIRLAVKLKLDIVNGWDIVGGDGVTALADISVCSQDGKIVVQEYKENDPCSALRRAIVRAAAEIGKNMK